jgi:hypothetical protein
VYHHGVQVSWLNGRLTRLGLQDSDTDSGQVSLHTLISVATTIAAEVNNPKLCGYLPPALKHAGGFHTGLSEGSDQLLPWQKDHLLALAPPLPASILHAFAPPPPDLKQWATFCSNSCPVSLGKQPSADVRPWFERVTLPSPPQAGATREQVEAYVAETKAQLGASFYALAPVAAAMSHRRKPWVGNLLSCMNIVIFYQDCSMPLASEAKHTVQHCSTCCVASNACLLHITAETTGLWVLSSQMHLHPW